MVWPLWHASDGAVDINDFALLAQHYWLPGDPAPQAAVY
jgi:hypothetical protein